MPEFFSFYGILHYQTNSPIKASIAENTVLQVKSLLMRMCTTHNTAKWIQFVDSAAKILNNRKRKSLGFLSPFEAHQEVNEEYVRSLRIKADDEHKEKMKEREKKIKPLAIGTKVRLVKDPKLFRRGFDPNAQLEILTITDRYQTFPTTYKVNQLPRKFYREEIRVVPQLNEKEKQYYIAGEKKISLSKLRSGRDAKSEIVYLLRARNDPFLSEYISKDQLEQLKQNGYL